MSTFLQNIAMDTATSLNRSVAVTVTTWVNKLVKVSLFLVKGGTYGLQCQKSKQYYSITCVALLPK